ncbi:MAG: hypothetical protein ACREFQ_14005, partial [Stellaceae bacterium]
TAADEICCSDRKDQNEDELHASALVPSLPIILVEGTAERPLNLLDCLEPRPWTINANALVRVRTAQLLPPGAYPSALLPDPVDLLEDRL